MNRPFLILALAGLALSTSMRARSYSAGSREYRIKAAFLFNFAQFVEWPDSAFTGPADPFVIGVLGLDPFGRYLDEVVNGETIRGREFVVRRYDHVGDAADCQMLFIAASERGRIEALLSALDHRPILTVGDMNGFGRSGGMIQFLAGGKRIHLRINVDAAESAGLSISAKLLSLADIVLSDAG